MRNYFYYVFRYAGMVDEKSVRFDVAERVDGSNNILSVMEKKRKFEVLGVELNLVSVMAFKTMKEARGVAERNNHTYKENAMDLYSTAIQSAENGATLSVCLAHYDTLRRECQHFGVNIPYFKDDDDRKKWMKEHLEDVKTCIDGSVSLTEIKTEIDRLINE